MRNILALSLAMFISVTLFSGCGTQGEPVQSAGITTYSTEGKTTALVGDTSATGTLTVDFRWSAQDDYKNRVKEMYQELYPNVEISIADNEPWNSDKFADNVKVFQVELMAGRGPDVFVAEGEANDLVKSMKAGAYADLTSYFEDDTAFNVQDFNDQVLYAGQYQGKQYLVPLYYYFPLVLTTQEILDETGFNVAKCTDYFSAGDEFARVLSENKLGCNPQSVFNEFDAPYYWTTYAGIPWIDYENEKVDLMRDDVKKVYEQLEELNSYLARQKESYQPHSNRLIYERLADKEIMFAQLKHGTLEAICYDVPALIGAGQKPVVFPYPNENGKSSAKSVFVMGVNNNCKNKKNAYQLIKLLMSPEFNVIEQDNGAFTLIDISSAFPISKEAMVRVMESLEQPPNHGTPQEGYIFLNGFPVEAGAIPPAFTASLMDDVNNIETVEFDSPIAYLVIDKMKPYLYDGADYDKCIQDAQQAAEIFISE